MLETVKKPNKQVIKCSSNGLSSLTQSFRMKLQYSLHHARKWASPVSTQFIITDVALQGVCLYGDTRACTH